MSSKPYLEEFKIEAVKQITERDGRGCQGEWLLLGADSTAACNDRQLSNSANARTTDRKLTMAQSEVPRLPPLVEAS